MQDCVSFGSFQLLPEQRLLLELGQPVKIGQRALDILLALIGRAGEIVGSDELRQIVWPDVVVDAAGLRVHMSALRKALRDGRSGNRLIANIPGRGYQFIAQIERSRREGGADERTAPRAGKLRGLPAQPGVMIGRDTALLTLQDKMRERFVTVVGAGGIGKTTVAVAAAEAMAPDFADGVAFVDLAPLSEPALVANAVASAVDSTLRSDDPIADLVAFLKDRHMLLVLDNCEHVIAAAAALAEALLRGASGIHILATSREPLRCRGEWVMRLQPLAVPPSGTPASNALEFSAVQLFSERAAANADAFALHDDNAGVVIDICRRLDGIPLALELAAASVGQFGLRSLAANLGDRFSILTQGRRTALPRQRTLRATLDWSYEMLPPLEQAMLRRLSVLRGPFTLQSATTLLADGTMTSAQVTVGISSLAAKSLIAVEVGSEMVTYRMLETTRTYAFERLGRNGELADMTRRHAEFVRDVMVRARDACNVLAPNDWRAMYGRHVDNLRAALDWTFGEAGDVALGVSLATAAVDFWLEMSLLSECVAWSTRAIAAPGTAVGSRDEMVLQTALGIALIFSNGMGAEPRTAFARAVALAETSGDADFQCRAFYGMWLFLVSVLEIEAGLELARRYEVLARESPEPSAPAVAHWMVGLTLRHTGELADAIVHLDQARAVHPPARRHGDVRRFGIDPRISALSCRSEVLWMQGRPEQAIRVVHEAVAEARAIDHPTSLGLALARDCTIALWTGDLAAAEPTIAELTAHSDEHLLVYRPYARCCQGALLSRRGDCERGIALLRAGLRSMDDTRYYSFSVLSLCDLGLACAASGQVQAGMAEIEFALQRIEQSSQWCYLAEALRVKGELLRAKGDGAEECFTRALATARQQGALSWELRAASSLARLWRDLGRQAEAEDVLRGVYARFTEGLDTQDLREARSLPGASFGTGIATRP